MHYVLFEHQHALEIGDLVRYAAALGLDLQRFTSEFASHTHAGRVREDFMSGVRSGVNRTPRLSTLLTYPHVATMSCHICLPVNAAVIRPRPGRSVE
jgi:hypothetical protein